MNDFVLVEHGSFKTIPLDGAPAVPSENLVPSLRICGNLLGMEYLLDFKPDIGNVIEFQMSQWHSIPVWSDLKCVH